MDAGPEAGMTLVELLVAMALLSLIALFALQGIGSLRWAAPIAGRLDAAEEASLVAAHLRRTFGEAVALLPDGTPAALIGTPDSVRFLAPADPLLESGGIAAITLSVEPAADDTLVLAERRKPSRLQQDEKRDANILLRGVKALRLAYGATNEDGSPEWRADWSDPALGTPALVRIELERADGKGRGLDLIVHPMSAFQAPAAGSDTVNSAAQKMASPART
ncbi:type II secretion system protein [Aureimonas sp. Leaf454]|uniref:type II secretion system protein n=1 Tax=Aureimonas sp. Leaf454 TaxID=1736381 RepID=UPI0006FC73A1|nr:type II secretion system protein [Aureimonas sp. Leaf454]